MRVDAGRKVEPGARRVGEAQSGGGEIAAVIHFADPQFLHSCGPAAFMDLAFTFFLAFGALVFEAYAGYPQALYRSIGHPVTWIGALISRLDRALNKESEDEDGAPQGGRDRLGVTLAVAIGACVLVMLLPAGRPRRHASHGDPGFDASRPEELA